MTYLNFGGIWVEYQGGNYGFTPPRYNSGVRTEAPAFVKNAAFFENTITYDGPSDYANAVVQAGGAVRINASQNLANSVVREGVTLSSGASKVGSTQLRGQMTPAIVEIHGQLPPNLAQQQLNPLTLPGFSLPTGQNGLFRLSGQSGATQQATQANAGPQSWTLGGASISTGQRQQGLGDLFSNGASPLPLPAQNDPLAATPVQAGDGSSGSASVAGQTVARVQGLPDTSFKSNPQKYLIETNPVLTDLKQFMSSDYLLENLGYDPDQSAKRLGDGLYEQRLIQEAVVARTGQRFIDGQTSNEDMFKYLMNNAIASKQELDLAVGVSLTSEQVAALTHDIVWLEEHVVNGEKVLVPVLYMAQANNRLAPNGALIQGADVQLIAGQDLKNAGTLRATNSLSAKATNDIVNSGLVEADGRLDLLADKNIVNKAGGVIAGRDVNLTTLKGDVINQRDVTGIDIRFDNNLIHRDYLDSAARIEAANDLKIDAGRNVNNIGGVLRSEGDLKLIAGQDVNITSVQDRRTDSRGSNFLNQTITQHAAEVTSGRDLSISADRDVAVVASRLDAKRDLIVDSGNDIVITSAANQSDYVSRSKRRANETHSVTQQSSVLNAGRDIALNAGNDLGIIASRIKATDDVSLDAVQDITVASAKDESSSYYYRKKKGSFGRSKTTQKESYESENVASVIEAGHDLTVNASKDDDGAVSLDGGRNVAIIGSQLNAGNDLVVGATQDVAVLSATEQAGSYTKKTKTGRFGMSKSGSSQLQTSVTQIGSELNGGHDAVVIAGRDVRLNASEINANHDAELHAGLVDKEGDITLSSADDQAYSRAEKYKKKVGMSLKDTIGAFAGTPGLGADITVAASQKGGREVVSSTSIGSQVNAGHDAILDAARDINVIGSGIGADNNASLKAGRDVNVVASIDQQRSNTWKTDKSVGLKQTIDSNAFSTFVGSETIQHGVNSKGYTAAGSSINAGINLNVDAGRDINQQGSDLTAENNIRFKAGRDINVDAKEEASQVTIIDSIKRNGLTVTTAYNIGNTIDGLKGTGNGEDGVSKGSSVLKAVDTLDQFFSGPKFDGHLGASSVSSNHTQSSVTQRPSTLLAGGDIALDAGNDVNVSGSQFNAGRDINVNGKNITLDVAHGSDSSDGHSTQSKGGVKGGTTGGFKLGVGVSNAGTKDKSFQGSSSPTQLTAGGNINLDAKNDLTLIGTQATAERDISLKAGNDLNILSAQNAYSSSHDRRSWGAEGGIIAGQDGFGVYGSVNVGIGDLNREGVRQQEAYLYAGNKLGFESGRDTNIAGATLRGDEVVGDVGRDLTVTSVPNTGKVEGKEFDASLTVAVSFGATVSGSLGYGQTNGKTNWVENQTVINGKNKVDIRTENHTQLDGSVITADNGNLKLDTNTLGHRNITGKDNEHGYYLSVSGSYGGGNGSQADKPNKGMEGKSKNSWAIEGYNYKKDREQVLNATVGAGQVVVRNDKTAAQDSTAGLNRDVNQAYVVTKDKEHRTDLYVSSSSVDAVSHPIETVTKWGDNVVNFKANMVKEAEAGVDFLTNLDRAISAQLVGTGDVPQALIDKLGSERALAVTKNFVRQGLDPEQIKILPAAVLDGLAEFAKQAADYEKLVESCTANNTCPGMTTSGGPDRPGSIELPPTQVPAELVTNGQLALNQVLDVIDLAQGMPTETFEATVIGIQALMGPMKFLLSMTANGLLNAAYGPEIDELKDLAAIKVASKLIGESEEELTKRHQEAKGEHDKGNDEYQYDGDGYVVATRFLIDAVLGEFKSLGIKASGRAIQILDKQNPHDVLGGPHRDTTKPKNDGFDSHHCPAKGCYVGAPISSKDGPAIKMSPADHARTASHGNSDAAVAYRAKQEELLSQGKLMEAIDMDVKDIRSKFGDKYDAAIGQMLDYASKLNPDDFRKK
ncbi:hypothetical protein DOCECA_18360 [Pseudomonas sp. E102]